MSFIKRKIKDLAKRYVRSNNNKYNKLQRIKTCRKGSKNCLCECISFLQNHHKRKCHQQVLTIKEKSIQLGHMFDAILEKNSIELKYILLQNSWYDINSLNEDGITTLHFASIVGDEQCILTLLEYGACKYNEDIRGRTALHYAILMEHENCQDILQRRKQSHSKDILGLREILWKA